MLPILRNHDHRQPPIGYVRTVDGEVFFEFIADVLVTREIAFEIFGNAGLRIIESSERNGLLVIHKGQLLEFSLP